MNCKPILGILLGDATGVGPELVAKLAVNNFYADHCRPVIIGDVRVFEMGLATVKGEAAHYVISDIEQADWEKGIPVLDQHNQDPAQITRCQPSTYCGAACIEMLTTAVELYKAKKIDGFSFAPLNKSAMIQSGCKFESEHHLMAHLFQHTEPLGEINVLGDVWTTRTTSHIPISKVSENLTVNSILRALRLANATLKNAGIERPHLGVAALNPHAGEHGLCGREELDVIEPAIAKANEMGIWADGPFPSDILFIKAFRGDFNGVVTMYHDQGQIALKLKGFDQGITIAGGLPAPIVTCAHGTAYDITGKGIASTSAFENAVKMTSKMAMHIRETQSVNA
ncbi:MAG: 4-hydroxythreonine-4-phosphate dehydrogenase PdxA [Angelakisella sp.]